jgi:hypothetical protein
MEQAEDRAARAARYLFYKVLIILHVHDQLSREPELLQAEDNRQMESPRPEFDHGAESLYHERVGNLRQASESGICQCGFETKVRQVLLPPRSMVGQLPLEQPIGVRIPGGQPSTPFQNSALLDFPRRVFASFDAFSKVKSIT